MSTQKLFLGVPFRSHTIVAPLTVTAVNLRYIVFMLGEDIPNRDLLAKIDRLNAESQVCCSTDPNRGLALAQEAEELLENLTDHAALQRYLFESLTNQVAAYYELAQFDRALSVALRANTNLGETAASSRSYGRLLNSIAWLYFEMADYPRALEYAQQLVTVAETNEHRDELLRYAYNCLGSIHGEMAEFSQSITAFEKCIELVQQQSEPNLRAVHRYQSNLCVAYFMSGLPDKAVEYGLKILELIEPNEFPRVYSGLLCTMAAAYNDMGYADTAEIYFLKSAEAADNPLARSMRATVAHDYSHFLYEQKQYDSAKEYADKALQTALEIGSRSYIFKSHELLSVIQEARGDLAQALHHYKQYHTMHNEVMGEDNVEKIRLLRILNEVDVAQKDAEIYRLRNEELERLVEERTIALRRALQESNRANLVRSNVIRTVSHQFRTPLTAINTSADLLAQRRHVLPPEKLQTLHTRIQDSIQNLSNLLNDVDKVEDANLGVLSPQYETIAFNRWAAMQRNTLMVEADNHPAVSYQYDQRDASEIAIDMKMMRNIISAILDNALRYSPDTPIHVEWWCSPEHLTIIVSDQGMGIALDDLDQIFEPFYRGKNVETTHGLGVGLYLANEMVRTLEGTITAESPGVNQGSTFTIQIPITQ